MSVRTCNLCGMYFASVKSVKEHKKICKVHSALNDVSRFGQPIFVAVANSRPVRVAAQRQREKMILWFGGNDKHADWVDEDDLDGVNVVEDKGENLEFSNIIDPRSRLQIPWEDDV